MVRAALVLGLASAALHSAPARAALDAGTYQDELSAGIQLEQKGDLKAALAELRKGIALYPANWNLRLEVARVYLKLGNSPAAEIEARNAQRAGADDDDVAPVLAQALLQQNKFSLLVTSIPPGTRDPKAEAAVRAALGLARLGLGDQAAGTELLHEATQLDPADQLSQIGNAQLLLLKGDLAGAERAFSAARAADPDGPDMLRFEASLDRAKGDMPGALAVLDKTLDIDPDDLGALAARASILITENKLDDANTTVDHALEVAPASIAPNFLKAVILVRRNKLKQADDILTDISQYFASIPNGYYVQGVVKYALGHYDEATDLLTKFIARRPNHLGARMIVAAIALKQGVPDRAIDTLAPYVDSDPTNPKAVALLAQAYDMAGERDRVLDLYERAARAQPNNPRTQVDAALMQIRVGDEEAGMDELEKIAATPAGIDAVGPILAMDELRRGEMNKADAAATALVKKHDKDLVDRNLLGGVRLAELRFGDAETIFRGIVATDPNFMTARFNLARTYLAMNRPADAKTVLLDILQKDPASEGAMLGLAEVARATGDFDGGVARLNAAIAAAPSDPQPGFDLVQLYAGAKQWDKANKAARDLVGRFPNQPNIIELAAHVRADSGDAAGAVKDYQPVTQQFAEVPGVWLLYSSFQFRAGDKDGARQSVRKALQLAPDDGEAMSALVDLDFATGGADAALATAKSFASTNPTASALLTANALVKAKRRDEAIKILADSQRIFPSEDTARRLAELTYDVGPAQHQAAEAILQGWLVQHGNAANARLALANMQLLDRNYDAAQATYERAFKDTPQDPVLLNNLAWLYAKKGDKRAREFAIRALRAAPNDQTADTLGWVLLEGGDAQTALPYLRQAAAGMPANGAVKYHLAAALEATGDKKQAIALLEEALQKDKDFDGKDDARRLLDRLRGG
jgi:putative PEP-CTERM system TPR-repeat lipoprotein